MRSLSLRVTFDEATIHPMHAFVSDDERYGPTRLRQWNVTDRGTCLMVFHVEGPREPYTDALESTPAVVSAEVVTTTEQSDQFAILVEDEITEDTRGIFEAYADEDVVTVPPVVFRPDRSADLQLVGSNAALQRTLDRLPAGMDAEIRRLTAGSGAQLSAAERLTTRQRRVLTVAREAGYYEESSSTTVADVAGELDLAAGTVAEHLRKAEARLVDHALGE